MLSIAAYDKAAKWPRPRLLWMQRTNPQSASMSTLNLWRYLAFQIAYFFPCRQSAICFGMLKSTTRLASRCFAPCARVLCQISEDTQIPKDLCDSRSGAKLRNQVPRPVNACLFVRRSRKTNRDPSSHLHPSIFVMRPAPNAVGVGPSHGIHNAGL